MCADINILGIDLDIPVYSCFCSGRGDNITLWDRGKYQNIHMYILQYYILHCDPSVWFKVQQTNRQIALVGIRACRGTYNNPLPKPMLPKLIASPGMNMVLWRGEVSFHLNYISQFLSYMILISLTRKYWTVNIVRYRQVFHIRRTLVGN